MGATTKPPATGPAPRIHVMLLLSKLQKSTKTNQMRQAKVIYSALAIDSKGVSCYHLQRETQRQAEGWKGFLVENKEGIRNCQHREANLEEDILCD